MNLSESSYQIENRIITASKTGQLWWSDGVGAGKAWWEPEKNRLVFGGYKSYGPAFHVGGCPDRPELERQLREESEERVRQHETELDRATLWPFDCETVHVSELIQAPHEEETQADVPW